MVYNSKHWFCQSLRETPCLPCAVHGKGFAVCRTRQRAYSKQPSAKAAFAVCNISSTRQSLCRMPNLTHGKLLGTTATMTWQSPLPCASPVWHTAKNGNFAVCCGHYTQQRARILNIFFVDYVYGTPNNTSISYIYITIIIACNFK